MRTIKILMPLLLFIVGGVFGIFSQDLIQAHKSIYFWFLIPAFVFGVYYAFGLTPKHDKNKGGAIALGRIAITILVTALSYRAIQGYVIYFNCYFGRQIETKFSGRVTYVDIPKPKKIFDKNTITIKLNNNEENITFEAISDDYYVGQIFSKQMFIGSFGILYSPK